MPADPRRGVVAMAQAMLADGLVEGSEGNVSVRADDVLHITPAGLAYQEMQPGDLVTLDLAGNVLAGTRAPSSERRVHLAIYAARPDVGAVVHTHSRHAIGWSLRGQVLELAAGHGRPVLTAPRAPAGSSELAGAVADALGEGDAVLMAGHGAAAVGPDPARALAVARAVEAAARAAVSTPTVRRARTR